MLPSRFILTLMALRVQNMVYYYCKENLKEILVFSVIKTTNYNNRCRLNVDITEWHILVNMTKLSANGQY